MNSKLAVKVWRDSTHVVNKATVYNLNQYSSSYIIVLCYDCSCVSSFLDDYKNNTLLWFLCKKKKKEPFPVIWQETESLLWRFVQTGALWINNGQFYLQFPTWQDYLVGPRFSSMFLGTEEELIFRISSESAIYIVPLLHLLLLAGYPYVFAVSKQWQTSNNFTPHIKMGR